MREKIISIIDRYRKYKRIIVPIAEGLVFIFILFFSYWIRLGSIGKAYIPQIIFLIPVFISVKIAVFWIFRLYHISFRYISLQEIINILKASFICGLFLFLINAGLGGISFMRGYPRSIVFIDAMVTFAIGSGIRLIFRLIYFPTFKDKKGKKTLIVGAGCAGEQLIRDLKRSHFPTHMPTVLIDDDSDKHNSIIHGVEIVGGREDIPRIAKDLKIDSIIISIPSASSAQLRRIMDYVRMTEVRDVKIVPGLFHILTGEVRLRDIRDITVEDILGRESIKIDEPSVMSYLNGKRILITGAGGSIGSELCRQAASFRPSSLIMVDIGDTALFYINRQIKEKFPYLSSAAVVADVKDFIHMKNIFLQYSPQVVFHAAAYKHVPLMENNPREATLNNIQGTKIPAALSIENNVEKFVFISTDKAINPVGVMGATKRVAENMLKSLDNRTTKFISVRFGNVLESRGSVIPLFKKQIQQGGPVTVTHPDMTRYFMSNIEAVYLILQAGAMGEGGEVFVLDMGKPIKILDLARDMIRFYGLEPDRDIPIVFTGKRPGEKLCEELLIAEKGTVTTKHQKIFITRDLNSLEPHYLEKTEELIKKAETCRDKKEIIDLLRELAATTHKPEFTL